MVTVKSKVGTDEVPYGMNLDLSDEEICSLLDKEYNEDGTEWIDYRKLKNIYRVKT